MPLYVDEESGKSISTHSMLKTFKRCPKQTEYKFVERLKPRVVTKPLKRGQWVHQLLEAYYKGEDWEDVHDGLSKDFSKLFDEEKEHYGNLPVECRNIMESYLWHYAYDEWKIHEVEFILDTPFPDGTIYRCKIDLMIEDEFGLWLVDHKTLAKIPDINFRILDAQSALYLWAAAKNDIPVQGFIWNYVRTKAPTVPKMTKKGRLSARKIDTDYPTMLRALEEYKLVKRKGKKLYMTPATKKLLTPLLAQRYRHGEPQTSEYFQRHILEKDRDMLQRVAKDNYKTSQRMHSYFPTKVVERVPDRSCAWTCSFLNICTVELFGGNSKLLRRRNFTEADPLSYYESVDKTEGGEN
jgi:PD-(D/E)XK nuclease superfamily